MGGLLEVLPTNPELNPFRAYLDTVGEFALIQPPFTDGLVLEEVITDVFVRVEHRASTASGTTVSYFDEDPTFKLGDGRGKVVHTFTRLLDALGATISPELFTEYYGEN